MCLRQNRLAWIAGNGQSIDLDNRVIEYMQWIFFFWKKFFSTEYEIKKQRRGINQSSWISKWNRFFFSINFKRLLMFLHRRTCSQLSCIVSNRLLNTPTLFFSFSLKFHITVAFFAWTLLILKFTLTQYWLDHYMLRVYFCDWWKCSKSEILIILFIMNST